MASTILYKFRSGTTFEALPLPGSAARLFDVKKAIVKAKKLDSGSMEFDLAVKNADTNDEYSNEAMILPRGTRLIVQRLPAQRGYGFLARMARNEQPGTGIAPSAPATAPQGFYTIENRDATDEFVTTGAAANGEDELAKLQAATNLEPTGPAMTGGRAYPSGPSRGGFPAGGGGPGGMKPNFHKPNFRPSADPELRKQEEKLMPKKGRATGIPRTFLNLNAPPKTDGAEGGENESSGPQIQPNTVGFKQLVKSTTGNSTGARRDLDYALKITSTTVPEHLQCGICGNVVKNAMLLPWDPEGRTTCESCIRDGLTQNGFRCPLTGMDGVSPDDLLPNVGLRKAAELFIKNVMDKVDEIELAQVEENEETLDAAQSTSTIGNILDGDGTEKGVIVSKKVSRKKPEDDDPFGGDDDFGGDVFAVEAEATNDDEDTEEAKDDTKAVETTNDASVEKDEKEKADETLKAADNFKDNKDVAQPIKSIPDHSVNNNNDTELKVSTEARVGESETPEKQQRYAETPTSNRRENRRRGPPVGYAMGPAGVSRDHGDQDSIESGDHNSHQGMRGGRGRGGRGGGRYQSYQDRGGYRGRGQRGRGRFGGGGDYDNNGRGNHQSYHGGDGDDYGHDDNRGSKRPRTEDHSDGHHRDKQHRYERSDDRFRGDSNEGRNFRGGGGRGRGGYRGGRGRSWGRGGGGYRGGHGRRY